MRKREFLAWYNRSARVPITVKRLGAEGFDYAYSALMEEFATAKAEGFYEIPAFLTKDSRPARVNL